MNNENDLNKPLNEKKSPLGRFFLILNVALPLVVLVVGILIITSPYILINDIVLKKYIIGGLFITYALFRIVQAFLIYKGNERENVI